MYTFELLSPFFILLNNEFNRRQPKLRSPAEEKLCIWQESNTHSSPQGNHFLRQSVPLLVQPWRLAWQSKFWNTFGRKCFLGTSTNLYLLDSVLYLKCEQQFFSKILFIWHYFLLLWTFLMSTNIWVANPVLYFIK